jgi:hypothetical protein
MRRYPTVAQSAIVDAQGHFLVNISLAEGPWATQGGAQICIQVIRTPESSLATLHLDMVQIPMRFAMDTQGEHEVSSGAK